MIDTDAVIVRALAAVDAVRLPIRDWRGRRVAANRLEAGRLLATHGVPLRVGGDAATRKTGERVLVEAAAAGLAVVTRHGRDKYPYVRLTAAGEARARALVGLPDRAVGRLFLGKVASLTDRRPRSLDRMWMDEIAANGGKGWGDAATREDRRGLSEIELDALPAISAGWIEAHSTFPGHVRYRVLAGGWDEIDRPSVAPDVGDLPAEDAEAVGIYREEQDARLAEMQTAEPSTPGEIGALPLPVAHVGLGVETWA